MVQKYFFYWQPNTQWLFVQKLYWYKLYCYKLYYYKLYLINCTKRSLSRDPMKPLDTKWFNKKNYL